MRAIGGKDSMSGSFEDLDVPPTLVSFAVTTDQVGHIVSLSSKGGPSCGLALPGVRSRRTARGGLAEEGLQSVIG